MPHPTDIAVGKNLRRIRSAKGYTQVDIAKVLGVSFQQVQKYETGFNRISASKLWDVAVFLQVPVQKFFAGIDGDPDDSMGFRTAEESEIIMAYRKMPARTKLSVEKVVKEIAGGY